MDLLADIGGTNARVAFRQSGNLGQVYLRCTADFTSLAALLHDVMSEANAKPVRAALAVAGPITSDEVQLTNLPWRFTAKDLAVALSLRDVMLENDVAAMAWSLMALESSDATPLTRTTSGDGGAKVVVAPGTGLGVAALVPDRRGGACVVASEGSHAGLAVPRSLAGKDRDALMACGGSWEDLVSGLGLARLYRALGGGAAVDTPEAVTRRAQEREALAVRTLDVFSLLLGAFAGDAVLMFAGRACYLAGGLLGAIGPLFKPDLFLKGFTDKGRFNGYMASVPVAHLTHPQPALLGLGVLLDRA